MQQLHRILSIDGKILARITLNGINEMISPQMLLKTQSGFRSNRSTIDMVLSFRQVHEKCTEQNMEICAVFIHFT